MESVKETAQNVLSSGTGNQAAWLDGKGMKLRVADAPIPTPEPNEILVKNHAIAVNPVDWKIQDYGLVLKTWPNVLGTDVAGEVVKVGSNVTKFKKGDRVLTHAISLATQKPGNGGFQLYTAAPALMAAVIPDSISYTNASVLPLAIDTATHGLLDSREKGFLELPFPSLNPTPSGKTLLIWGGSSSVGAVAIQLAVAGGSKVVAVASKRNHDFVTKLGASAVIDYNDPNVVEDVIKALQALGGEFAGIYDAISTAESYKFTVPIAEKVNAPSMATVLPSPENLPAGTKGSSIFTMQPQLLGPVWKDFVTPALEQGKLKTVPEPLVVGKGLDSVQKGLDTNKAGVSARKVVIEL